LCACGHELILFENYDASLILSRYFDEKMTKIEIKNAKKVNFGISITQKSIGFEPSDSHEI